MFIFIIRAFCHDYLPDKYVNKVVSNTDVWGENDSTAIAGSTGGEWVNLIYPNASNSSR